MSSEGEAARQETAMREASGGGVDDSSDMLIALAVCGLESGAVFRLLCRR